MSMTPGFQAYLRRTHPEEFVEEAAHPVVHSTVESIESGEGISVVEVKDSKSIQKMVYNAKRKDLTTYYMTGSHYTHGNVEPETFDIVCHPGEEYGFSIGKAHYALIVAPRKQK